MGQLVHKYLPVPGEQVMLSILSTMGKQQRGSLKQQGDTAVPENHVSQVASHKAIEVRPNSNTCTLFQGKPSSALERGFFSLLSHHSKGPKPVVVSFPAAALDGGIQAICPPSLVSRHMDTPSCYKEGHPVPGEFSFPTHGQH